MADTERAAIDSNHFQAANHLARSLAVSAQEKGKISDIEEKSCPVKNIKVYRERIIHKLIKNITACGGYIPEKAYTHQDNKKKADK